MGQLQLLEEDVRETRIMMLPSMQEVMLDWGVRGTVMLFERPYQHSRLHELWPSPDN
jgi:hypothetical protein